MLVLNRAVDQSVLIRVPGRENLIRVMLVKMKAESVRIGFDADEDIEIFREELEPREPVER